MWILARVLRFKVGFEGTLEMLTSLCFSAVLSLCPTRLGLFSSSCPFRCLRPEKLLPCCKQRQRYRRAPPVLLPPVDGRPSFGRHLENPATASTAEGWGGSSAAGARAGRRELRAANRWVHESGQVSLVNTRSQHKRLAVARERERAGENEREGERENTSFSTVYHRCPMP